MLRLIRAEIYKLFKTKKFIVLCVIAVLLSLSTIGMTKLMSTEDYWRSGLIGMSTQEQDEYIQNLSTPENAEMKPNTGLGLKLNAKDILRPTAKDIFYDSFGASVVEILMAVLIGGLVASEYSSGTIKNILAYGKKREYYYISKLLASTVGLTVILGLMVSLATVVGSLMYGWGEPFTFSQFGQIIGVFAGAIVVGMGIIAVLMLVATLLKSNGATIGIGIVVMGVLPAIISFLYGKYTWFDKIYDSSLSYNWALATFPNSSSGDVLKAAAVGLITTVVAILGGIVVFKRQDIK